MRIHAIRVQNINSLTATADAPQVLDLDADLGDAPIFLIRGPTGAGKSTLLDAVTLALFGQTARLDRPVATRASDDDDLHPADPRNALTHGEGAGFAEVEFSILRANQRRRYRARWTVRRARDLVTGGYQPPVRTLWPVGEDGEPGPAIVESYKSKEYEVPFSEVLGGLTFDDFVRSVLLAQGEFQAFLKASPEQRSALLERLTDATRFRAIGQAAAHRVQTARSEVAALRARLEASHGLRSEERLALETEVRDATGAAERALAMRRDAGRSLEVARALHAASARFLEANRSHEAARAAFDAVAPEVARLDAHARAAPFEAALGRLDASLELVERHSARLVALDAEAPRLEAASNAAEAAVRDAEAETRRAREAALGLRPLLVAARSANQAEEAARRAAADARADAGRAAEVAEQARQALGVAEAALAAVRDRARELSERLAKVDEPARYGERAAVAGRALQTSRALEAEHDAAARRVEERRAAAAEAAARLAAAETERTRLEAAAAAAGAALAAARDTVRRIGGEADEATASAALKEAVAAALAERRQAEERGRAVAALGDAELELAAAEGRAASAAEAARTTAAALESARVADRVASARLEVLRAERETAARYGEIARKRGLLRDGEACPLCGSEAHPYREHPERAPSDAAHTELVAHIDAELQALGVERAALSEAVRAAEARDRDATAGHAAALASADGRRVAVERLRSELEALGGSGTTAAEAAAALSATEAQVREATARQEAFEVAVRGWRAAEVAAQSEGGRRDRAVEVAIGAAARVEDARRSLAEAEEALTTRRDALSASREALAGVLRGLGVVLAEDPTPEELARCVERVEVRARGIADALVALEAAEREAVKLGERATSQATSLKEKAADAEGRAAVAAEAAARLDAATRAVAEALAALGGRAPDEAEAAADRRLQQAQSAEETARAHLGAAREARVENTTVRATTDKGRLAAISDAETISLALSADLEAAGWEDRESLRAALLDAASRRALESSVQARRDADTEARAALLEARAAHDAAAVAATAAGIAPDAPPPLTQLQAALETAERAAAEASAAVGAATEKLRADDVQRAAREALEGALTAAELELARWEAIHKVIGRNDGNAFVQLAQAFHLEELAARANARLSDFSRRYSLAVRREEDGTPTLDFVIVDTEQAGRQRPPSTLSGGETFIISLALALALADFRTAEMPIETVLIDEGFGTLDPETLAVILATLESLHASTGSRIGLISHVGMLAEAIPARVFVRPVGQGRSVLEVEAR